MRTGLGMGIPAAALLLGGAAALDLNFLGGWLDPRVTFTRASTATCFGSDGLLKTAPADAPRFDYDPVTLAPKGLLIEGARTNLLTRSAEFDDAAWVKTNANPTANATSTPLGPADDLIETVAAGTHGASQSISVTTATAYTFSIYAKAKGRSLLRMGSATLGAYAVFDLAAGTVQYTDAGVTAKIEPIGGGLYRCMVTQTATATTVYSWILRTQSSTSEWPGSGAYTGDGVSGVSVIGAQLEVGAFASSYIPTTTAAVTRAAERAEISPANTAPWLNKPEGTFNLDFIGFGVGATCGVLFVQKAGAAPRYQMSYSPNGAVGGAVVNDASVVTLSGLTFGAPIPHGSEVRSALAYKVLDVAGTRNGAVPATGAPASIPLTIDTVLIGEANNERLFGHVRRLRYWPTRLSNARLQELTA